MVSHYCCPNVRLWAVHCPNCPVLFCSAAMSRINHLNSGRCVSSPSPPPRFFNNHLPGGRGTFPLKLKRWIKDKHGESAEPGTLQGLPDEHELWIRGIGRIFFCSKAWVGHFTQRFLSWGHGQVPPRGVGVGGGGFVDIRFWSTVCDLWECDGWLLPWVIGANTMRESLSRSEYWPSLRPLVLHGCDVNN